MNMKLPQNKIIFHCGTKDLLAKEDPKSIANNILNIEKKTGLSCSFRFNIKKRPFQSESKTDEGKSKKSMQRTEHSIYFSSTNSNSVQRSNSVSLELQISFI